MKTTKTILQSAVFAALLIGATGCESTGSGGSSVSGGMYYGTGWYDPWYYDGYYDHDDIIVTPPPTRPASPEQPIYRPPASRPTPMPSIPSTPRPSVR
jgi:hypothetical protein